MAVKADKRSAILDAAEEVIARQGYNSAQVSRIAAEAGVAAGTVYLYFKNKHDLLISLFRDRLNLLIREARENLSAVYGPEEKLRCFIAQHLRIMGSHPNLATVTQVELRHAYGEVRKEVRAILKGYFAVIDEIVAEGQQTGVFLGSVDGRQIRNLVFGTLDQTVSAWVISGFKFDLLAQSDPTYRLIMNGVRDTDEGGIERDGNFSVAQTDL